VFPSDSEEIVEDVEEEGEVPPRNGDEDDKNWVGTGPPRGKYGKFRVPERSGFPGLISTNEEATPASAVTARVPSAAASAAAVSPAVALPKHVTMHGVVHTSTERRTAVRSGCQGGVPAGDRPRSRRWLVDPIAKDGETIL
jgi:hypothetical protein